MSQATRSADVLVIGAGVIGLSTALELRRAGLRVCVLERTAVGRGAASWAGGGILSPLEPDGVDDATLPILRNSLAGYADWCAGIQALGGVDPEYTVSGVQVLAPADAMQWTQAAEAWGLRVASITGDATASAPVVTLPDVAQVRSPRLLQSLLQAFRSAGGECVENEAVHELVGGERVVGVRTGQGTRHAAVVVVAAGAWSGQLGAALPIRPVRGQMLLLQAQPGDLQSIVLREGRYLIPRRDGRVLVGSTLEDVGFADTTTDAARDSLLKSLRQMAPALADRPVIAHWAGLRPAPQGRAPVIGWSEERRGLFVNSGHHRLGITLAPGSAREAARRILDAKA
ncbi:glycine oxidase [Panacagrimonas perspica]|uniref:Glycine oxidase n=1 Tax=Panacagrimonas perspica TaxID=381431 RepID=A0A4S3K826_9GAMM|nr:FAD-dependent oxidoreductase [Panacagrimonas perspica]TDU32069.1 glycine oxidase [Panacagrimonas perspica]THD04402.1 hypothetical protein B1810_05190 [Panacagrimonas perspica]